MIDNRSGEFPTELSIIQHLCDRRFGVGADGLILIENHPTADYRMVYYNSDGTQSLCGNGSRCGFAFAQELGIVKKTAYFETTDGFHHAMEKDQEIHFAFPQIENSVTPMGKDSYINTGSPHHVCFVSDIEDVDVVGEGRKIRSMSAYSSQNGTNVNFAQLLKDRVKMRTYERGVEDETLSCGTGATAVALVAARSGMSSPVLLETKGGELSVSFDLDGGIFKNIWLAGPAKKVFEGTTSI